MEHYIGVDLGKQSSYFVVEDSSGNILHRAKVSNDRLSIEATLTPYLDNPCRAVLEATCNYYWMYEQLNSLGVKVVLAHPLKTRAIADAKVKNDRLDAEILTRLLRAGLIPQSYIPSEKIRALRELTRQHIRLTQIRTRIKNQGHSLLVKLNLQPTERMSDIFGKKGRSWLKAVEMPEVFGFQRDQIIEQLEQYNHLIQSVDWKIEVMLREFPQAERLRAIPGVGMLGAAMIIGEIGEIRRFPSPKQLVGYAGMTPGLYASGNTYHQRGITHEGNKFLRWILCEIAQHHILKTGPLRNFYLRLKQKKGHGKAVVATARKLLTQIYYVLKDEKTPVTALAG